MFAGFSGHADKNHIKCLNSYNWLVEGKHNADMALCENEFDSPAVQQNERRSRLALYLTSSEMALRLPADFMTIYIYFLDLIFSIVKIFILKFLIISMFS